MLLRFATGNTGKVEEIRERLDQRDSYLKIEQIEVDMEEVQNLDAEEVAAAKARESYMAALSDGKIDEGEPIVVEDTGFYVEKLEGFPGTMAKHFAVTVGADGLIPLMEGLENRSARFKSVIALHDGDETHVFPGELLGKVPEEPRGDAHEHLPYNSLMVPEGESETLAENPELKDGRHHRNRAIDSFLDWLDL